MLRRDTVLLWSTAAFAVYEVAVVGNLPTWAGIFISAQIHGAVSLAGALALIFIGFGTRERKGGGSVRHARWFDLVLMASALASCGYVVFFYERILEYATYGFLDTEGIVLALMLAIPLLEAVRRVAGLALPIVIVAFAALTMLQPYLPGALYGRGYDFDRLLFSIYVGTEGIFGLPLRVAARILIVYLIFGAAMQAVGAGKWFIDLATALSGRSTGGAAKVAVAASAMFGSVSGSPSANAASIGLITIPAMMRAGYRPAFAAAVEAVASTGGQILPPVMGAIAFVMADWIGTPFWQVAVAATVPALLYFLIVFVSIHLHARRQAIQVSREQVPAFWPCFRRGWYHLIPLGALVYFLVIEELPPGVAGMYALGVILASSFVFGKKGERLTLSRVAVALQAAVRSWVVIAAVTGSVGIMVGALELSGIGLKFSDFLIALSGNEVIPALILVGLASLLLGMGLDSIPAYVTLATLTAPALVAMGVPELSAHLFVVYWGLASFFTPPTCIAVFVACGISGSRIWETGWESMKLGVAAFIVPFAFVLNDGLLLKGGPGHIALAVGTAVAGSVLLAGGLHGYLLARLNTMQRLLCVVSGVLFIAPGVYLPLAGAGLAVGASLLRGRAPRSAVKAET